METLSEWEVGDPLDYQLALEQLLNPGLPWLAVVVVPRNKNTDTPKHCGAMERCQSLARSWAAVLRFHPSGNSSSASVARVVGD